MKRAKGMVIRKRKDWWERNRRSVGEKANKFMLRRGGSRRSGKQRYENEAKSSVSCTDPEWGLHFCKHTNRSSEMDTARI